MAYENTTAHQLPSTSAAPCVSVDDLVTASHTFTFDRYSRRQGFQVGKYLVSDTFAAGGYEWAITLYPNGKKDQDKDYMSLYIRLESEQTHVNAVFQLTLVDQSGRGKHITQTQFGFFMRQRGSQWGFGQYMTKKYLEKLGYLKDDCLVVKCVVGVLAFDTELEITAPKNFISSYLPSSLENETTKLKQSLGMKESDSEDTKLPDLESAAKVIIQLGPPLQLQGLIIGDRNKFDRYLYAVDMIQQSIKSGMICGYKIQGAHAMKTLQMVFKGILNCSISTLSSTPYSSTVTSSYDYELQGSNHTDNGELSSEQVYGLRSIVERLNSAGCVGHCIQVYRVSRKSAVDARFLRFCIGEWTANDLQSLGCEEFAAKIRIWIVAAYKCYDSIFPGEKQYYEQIFGKVRAATYDNCFLAVIKHAAIKLNNFAEAVSTIASFQKLFAVLELYKALVVILPKIQNMFHSESFTPISHCASNTTDCLQTLVRNLILCFEDTVLNERLNCPPSKGTIHSLTEYTMNYVASILLYKELLTKIIVSPPTKSLRNQEDDNFMEASKGTPLGLHIIWIIMSLRINLEGKTCFWEDSLLRYIFLMNNVGYI